MLEKISIKATEWIGTPISIVIHTLAFIGIFALWLFGVKIDQILLILTTAVSLEAIYLAIFIQMTVNRNTASLEAVEEDIDELQEDVEDITEDVEDLQEDDIEEDKKEVETEKTLKDIEAYLIKVQKDIELLRKGNTSKT